MSQKKTKIIATVGPASEKEEMLEQLVLNGVDCLRLNFSHNTQESHGAIIQSVRNLEKKLGKSIAIIADMQGPKMRVGKMPTEGFMLEEGETVTIDTSKKEFENNIIPLPSRTFTAGTNVGDDVYLDDGVLHMQITKKEGTIFTAKIIKGGLLFSNKGSNVPSLSIEGSILNEKDKSDITFATKAGADYIALSFLRTAQDVKEAREFITDKKIKIVAKIERPEALLNIDEIIDEVDAVMVARGDLGIETPLWELPVRQKEIIQKVRQKMKPVIVATQMLDSMIRNPLPTRAEVSDVANAVYDSADAVMLSGESASGKNPLEAVTFMRKILEATEATQTYVESEIKNASQAVTIAKSASDTASEMNAKAIFVETLSGESARMISFFRPKNHIVAVTTDQTIARQLCLVWGVIPFALEETSATKITDFVMPVITSLEEKGVLAKKDTIVCVYDETFEFSGKANTNTITIKTI